MTFHRISLRAVWLEACRNVVVARAARVEPVFERRAPAAMPEHAPVPHAFERRNFIVAGSSTSFHCQIGVCADRYWKDVVLLVRARRRGEALGGSQLVVGIERRGVKNINRFLPAKLFFSPMHMTQICWKWR